MGHEGTVLEDDGGAKTGIRPSARADEAAPDTTHLHDFPLLRDIQGSTYRVPAEERREGYLCNAIHTQPDRG